MPLQMMMMHAAGVFRALGSVIDCLAAVLVGVLALPEPIQKVGWKGVVVGLREAVKSRPDPGGLRTAFLGELDHLVQSAGPTGWLDWALDFRNMLVHRGRRLNLGVLEMNPSLLRPDGVPHLRTEAVRLLLRDPGRSDIEELREGLLVTLTESAEVSMREVVKSVNHLVEGCATALRRTWDARRATPELVRQPRAQWPKVPSKSASTFPGYAPGSTKVPDIKAILVASSWPARLKAASLEGDAKKNWDTF